ncbi:MAG: TAXI family TRAP transporter solute-binding subunit [Pseudomonadota bacterium]
MRRRHSVLGFLVVGLLMISMGATAQEKILIGTAPSGGTYYAIGAGVAQILNKWAGLNATAQATGGGTQNCRLIEAGEINAATVAAQQLTLASKGDKPFGGKIDLRIGFYMYEDPFEVVVLDESPIRSIYDLKGKKVGVGAMGSGVEGKTKAIFASYGLSYEDFTPRFVGMAQAIEALKDGMVDAAVVMGALPTAAIVEISLLKKVRILPIEDEMRKKILKELPFLVPFVIPANTYKNQPAELNILAENSFIVFSPKMTDDVAYRFVKAVFEHLDYLKTVHKSAERYSLQKACAFDLGVPYHPGAIKYFKETGVWKR